MKTNDNILLEKAYEKILYGKVLNESNVDFKRIPSDLKEIIKDVDLNVQNFNDAIKNGSLEEGRWYIHTAHGKYVENIYKVVGKEDGIIVLEDSDKFWLGNKTIEKNENSSSDVEYKIYNPSNEKDYKFGVSIKRDDTIVGPIDNENNLDTIENYVDGLSRRTKSMSGYFSDKENPPLD